MSVLQSKACGAKDYYRRWWDGKHSMQSPFCDKFLTFKWRNQDSWYDYGCFIINEKDDIHWQGISTKNNYSSALFGSNNQTLSQISFDPAKLTLKLGLYGVTKKDYAKFYNWMNPLVIDKLFFDYDFQYFYKVKVASLKEATRYILGNQNNEDLYYIETSVVFEIQGENCGWSEKTIEWKPKMLQLGNKEFLYWVREDLNRNISLEKASWISELRDSVQISLTDFYVEPTTSWNGFSFFAFSSENFLWQPWIPTGKELFYINYDYPKTLFNINYNSRDGILYYNEEKNIITPNDWNIKSFNANKFLLPSKLNDESFYTKNNLNTIARDVVIAMSLQGSHDLNNEGLKYDNNTNSYYWQQAESSDKKQFEIKITSQLKTPII